MKLLDSILSIVRKKEKSDKLLISAEFEKNSSVGEQTQLEIPNLPPNEIKRRADKIRPVFIDEDGFYFSHPIAITGVAFTWAVKPSEERVPQLEKIATIPTLHTYGYYGFFKPTIAEVLAQIPENLLDKTDYFSIKGPETASDLSLQKREVDAGFHLAQTTLYKKVGEPIAQPSEEPSSDFQAAIKQGLEVLGREKMVEICETQIYLDRWAAGTAQPMKRTKKEILEKVKASIEDMRSDPTNEMDAGDLELIKDAAYAVECSRDEVQLLWEKYASNSRYNRNMSKLNSRAGAFGSAEVSIDWPGNNRRCRIIPIGKRDGERIWIEVEAATIEGFKILFVSGESQLVDYKMMRKWMDKYLKCDKTNTGNFHNCISYILDLKKNSTK